MSYNIKDIYFIWMASLALPNEKERESYKYLLNALYNASFSFTIPLDKNRSIDGMKLRYRFGDENNISNDIIRSELDTRECSMLEMMIALALRVEEHITFDDDMGTQIEKWFKEMMVSLKIDHMVNHRFDDRYFDYAIDKLLNREYDQNGSGGLFTVDNPRQDMRTVEIWYQMAWYLNTVINN